MSEPRRLRLVVEVVLGVAPATFLLLPLLLAIAAVAGGAINLATAMMIGCEYCSLVGPSGLPALG